MKQARGHIAGAWIDQQVVVQVDNGDAVELPAPAPIQDSFSVGEEVTLYIHEDGHVAGWICTASRIGVICDPAAPHPGRIVDIRANEA